MSALQALFGPTAASGFLQNFEPGTGQPLPTVPTVSPEDVAGLVGRARVAQGEWARLGFAERRRRLCHFKNLLLERAEKVADVISRENGKPPFEAMVHDVLAVADLTGFYARRAKRVLADEQVGLRYFPNKRSTLRYVPRGVVGIISPWNFPFSLPMGEVITALAAGNAAVVKPSEFTPFSMIEGKALLEEAGVPSDLVMVIPGRGEVGQALIEAGVDMIVFIGSARTGRRVAAECGKRLIPCVMELGGKDPAVVLHDAALDLAAERVVLGAFANSGQICASVERVYVDARIADAFIERVVARARALRQGDGRAATVDVGAMTTPAQLEIVERHVEDAKKRGARVLTGGARLEGAGRFYPPTVLTGVTHEMALMREESFGPLLPIMTFNTEEEAVSLANDSEYGLNAYVFSRDKRRAEAIAHRLEAGTVMVNDVLYTHGAPELPWGGIKQSGIGRTHSTQALRDMCWIRHVNQERFAFAPPWLHPYPEKVGRLLSTLRNVMRRLN